MDIGPTLRLKITCAGCQYWDEDANCHQPGVKLDNVAGGFGPRPTGGGATPEWCEHYPTQLANQVDRFNRIYRKGL